MMGVSFDSVEAVLNRHRSDFIFVKDKNSQYIEANDVFLSFYGFNHVEELRDKTDYDLPSASFAEQYITNDRVAITAGELQVIEEVKGKNGHHSLILTNKYPFSNPETQQSGVVGVSRFLNLSTLGSLPAWARNSDVTQLKISDTLFKQTLRQNTHTPLTERELDVLYYFLHGLSQKKIADKLNLSIRTIEDHIDHIKFKLQCGNKDQLFDFATCYGLMNIIPRKSLSMLFNHHDVEPE